MRVFLFCILLIQLCCAQPKTVKEIKICLSLTIKNEDVVGCLESVKNLVDFYTFVNAGATDQTIEFVEDFCQKNQISKFEEAGSEEIYFLVLESDMRLNVSPSFDKNALIESAYFIPEKWPNLDRYRLRLYREGREFAQNAVRMKGLEILPLLTPEKKESFFERALIQTGLKNYPKAVMFFEERIKQGGDFEEIWYSKYMLGLCYEQMGQWDRALIKYLDVYQANPDRLEPLLKISSHYRSNGQNDLAHIFAKYGNGFVAESDSNLVDPSYATYKWLEDLSIASYYTRFRSDGLIAANALLLDRETPWYTKELASRNILYYVQNIPNARFQPIILDLPFIEECDERYHPMNPSICKTEEGYSVICRSVNYSQMGAKFFHTNDPDGIYRTRNFFLSYDRNFNLISQTEIQETVDRQRYFISNFVEGLEDCRIFQYENDFWFTCTSLDGNIGGIPQIALCKLGKETVERFIPLLGPDQNRCEKNWLPFIKNQELQMIYSSDPFTVFRPSLESGNCEKVLEYVPRYDFSRFRGSAAPIAFDDGYLMMVHEVSFLGDGSRVYLHRFVYLDLNLEIKKISLPFTFTHQGIEFCCGMTLSHERDSLVMTIGIEDNQAFFVFIDPSDVRSMLLTIGGQ